MAGIRTDIDRLGRELVLLLARRAACIDRALASGRRFKRGRIHRGGRDNLHPTGKVRWQAEAGTQGLGEVLVVDGRGFEGPDQVGEMLHRVADFEVGSVVAGSRPFNRR